MSKIQDVMHVNTFNDKYKNDNDKLNQKIERIEKKMKKLKPENERYKEVEEDITPKTVNESKLHLFVIIQKNKRNSKNPLYAMRAQRLSYKRHLNRLKERYPKLEVVYELNYDPNSTNLFKRIREQFTDVDVRFNGIKLLNNYTLEQFNKYIEKLCKIKVRQ